MSSSAPDMAQSSRAGKQEAEQEPPKWVALVSVADLLRNEDDERVQKIVLGTDLLLDLNDPPLPSYLVLHPRLAPNPRRNDGPLSAYILATTHSSACILLQVVEGTSPDFFLCNTHSRTANYILPPVSSSIQDKGIDILPLVSMGLIADPHHRDHYMVAQLNASTSRSIDHPAGVLFYSTAKARWFTRDLTLKLQEGSMPNLPNPFSETGVLAHDGRLWWLALAYGVFFCDPFTRLFEPALLRFVPLPAGCELEGNLGFDIRIRTLLHQRRCVRLSEGKLRFVEIGGLSYDELLADAPAIDPTVSMWTLDDTEGSNPWTLEYKVAFDEIWDNTTYADAGLLPRELPHIAFVDPNDHNVVYFFQGSKLFGLDMREKKVVACKECQIDRDQLEFQSSRPIVDAWVPPPPPPPPPLPPTLPGDDDSSSDDSDFWRRYSYAEVERRQSINSWLDQARAVWTRDADASDVRTWKMAPPLSDESSANSGDQADDEPEIQLPPSP